MRRRLVERGAMPDRGEHVEERLVVGGGVVRRRARHQRDVRRTRDRRALRDEPAISGMEVIAHEHRRALAPEALADQLRVAERFAAVPVHQGIDHRAARPADDRDAVVELAGIHMGRITLDEQRRGGQAPASPRETGRRWDGARPGRSGGGSVGRARGRDDARLAVTGAASRPSMTSGCCPVMAGAGSRPSITSRGWPLTPASCAALTARHSWRYPVRLRARRRRREPPASSSSVPMIGWMPCGLRRLDQLDRPVQAVAIAETERGDSRAGRRSATMCLGEEDPSRKE